MIYYGKQNINQDDIDAVVDVLKSDFLTHSGKFLILDLANDNNHFLKNAKSKWRYNFN